MKLMQIALAVLALSATGTMLAPSARADNWDKKTVLTFKQPFEIPGQVLPAGTYTFQLLDSANNRNIVEIFNADGSQIVATLLAINNYRLVPTNKTVITFAERSGDRPDALKAWFYPGNSWGQEFVYPKQRAIQLAVASNEPVPALTTDVLPQDLKGAPIVAITPEQKVEPVASAIQTEPLVAQNTSLAPAADTKQLPATASLMPLLALFAIASLGFAFVLKRIAG